MVQDSMVMVQGSRFLNLGTKILKIKVQDCFFSGFWRLHRNGSQPVQLSADESGKQFPGYI